MSKQASAGCVSVPMALRAVPGVLKHFGLNFMAQALKRAELVGNVDIYPRLKCPSIYLSPRVFFFFHMRLHPCFCLSLPIPSYLPVTLLPRSVHPTLLLPPLPPETTLLAAWVPGLTHTRPSLTRTHHGTTMAGGGTTTTPTGLRGGMSRTSLRRATPTGSGSVVGPTVA